MAAKSALQVSETLSYCTSCKMDLNHRVVAMQGDRIAKVQCMTCKKEHQYRAPKGVKDPSKAIVAKEKKSKAKAEAPAVDHSVEAEWRKLMVQHKDTPVRAYSAKTAFALGDKIKHVMFGEGVVNKLIYPNKVEVVFQTDVKVLIHGA